MDYNQNNNYYNNPNNYQPQQPPVPRKKNAFSIASMVCGIVSIVACCMGLSLPLGALGILFALLTHRKGKSLDSMSITGIVTSGVGFFLGLVMVIAVFASIPAALEDPTLRNELDSAYEDVFGMDFEEFWESYYGINID